MADRVAREQLVDHLSLVCERLIEILDGTTAPALGTGEKSHEATERDERRADARRTVNRLAKEGRVHQLLVNFCLVCGRPLSKHDEPRELYLDGFVCSASWENTAVPSTGRMSRSARKCRSRFVKRLQ